MSNVVVNEPYKLMRARKGRMISGVAAGLAQSSGLDVTVVRICIGATMLSGLGVAAYILMWIVLPEESPKRGRIIEPAPEGTARAIRITLIVLAALSALNEIDVFSPFDNGRAGGRGIGGLLGLTLLGIGAAVLFSRHRPDHIEWLPAPPPPVPSQPRPPRPADDDDLAPHYFDDEDEPPTYAGPLSEVMGTVHSALSDAFNDVRTSVNFRSAQSANAAEDDYDAYDDEEYGYGSAPRVAMVTASGTTARSGGVALGFARVIGWLAVIWFTLASVATGLLWYFDSVEVTAPILLVASASVVYFAVLNTLIYAKFARAIVPALALLLIPVGIAAASVRPIGAVGEQISTPPRLAADETRVYELAMGALRLDLSETDIEDHAKINARNGVGAIFVTVPNDVAVKVTTEISMGAATILGTDKGASWGKKQTSTFKGCKGAPTIELNMRTGVGYVEVKRDNLANKLKCAA